MTDEKIVSSPSDLMALLKGKFRDAVVFNKDGPRRLSLKADRSIILELCEYVHEHLNFEHASSVTGVDWETHMQVVYHLSSYDTGIIIEVMVDVPYDDLTIDSVANIWEGANWHEREIHELFGIVFNGHPDLRRLLTPDDYEFFPFRKSYKLRGQE